MPQPFKTLAGEFVAESRGQSGRGLGMFREVSSPLGPSAGREKASVFHPVHSFNRLMDGVFFWAGLSGPDEIDANALH